MRRIRSTSAFTLIELLVVIGIVAILVAVSFPAYSSVIKHAQCAGCVAHMRTLGLGFTTYATDNDGQFPGRVTAAGVSRWPTLLLPYVSDVHNYLDPGDMVATKVPLTTVVSDSSNNSSFFFNGFNDSGAYTDQSFTMRLSNLTNMSNLILLGQKMNGNTQFYMDFVEGNQANILNKSAYFKGANYTFADGSSRFIYQADYDKVSSGTASDGDKMWLVDQSYTIPPPPH